MLVAVLLRLMLLSLPPFNCGGHDGGGGGKERVGRGAGGGGSAELRSLAGGVVVCSVGLFALVGVGGRDVRWGGG